MEKLPKELNREILLNLSPPDIINFCLSNKEKNQIICEDNNFWFKKLERDYPSELYLFYKEEEPVLNTKYLYIERFTYVSKSIENMIQKFKSMVYGPFNIKYVSKKYDDDLYKTLYKVYLSCNNIIKVLNLDIYKLSKNDRSKLEDIIDEELINFFIPSSVDPDNISRQTYFISAEMVKLIQEETANEIVSEYARQLRDKK